MPLYSAPSGIPGCTPARSPLADKLYDPHAQFTLGWQGAIRTRIMPNEPSGVGKQAPLGPHQRCFVRRVDLGGERTIVRLYEFAVLIIDELERTTIRLGVSFLQPTSWHVRIITLGTERRVYCIIIVYKLAA